MIIWILRRVAPKYFVTGLLCLAFGTLATCSGILGTSQESDLRTLSGVVEETFTRCTRGHSCTDFISLRTGSINYTVSLTYCGDSARELAAGDVVSIEFQQSGWNKHGGSAFSVVRYGFPLCTHQRAIAVQAQRRTFNLRLGMLSLAIAAVALIAAFVVGAARGYR